LGEEEEDEESEEGEDSGPSGSDLDASAESFDSSESVDLGFDGGMYDGEEQDEGADEGESGDDGISMGGDEGEGGDDGEDEEMRDEGSELLVSGAEGADTGRSVPPAAGREATGNSAAGAARVEMFW
jgi:hypothetical protein